jgi:phage internal scaffolding protein
MTLKIRKPLRRYKGSTVDTGEGLTEQAHKNETDMNYILRDYVKTGLIKHAKDHEGKYDDISVQDFQEAMFIVSEANSMFEELPGEIRKNFNNDPSQFLGFVQNPDNMDAMAKMGILKGNDGVDISGAVTLAPTEAQKAATDAQKLSENTPAPTTPESS